MWEVRIVFAKQAGLVFLVFGIVKSLRMVNTDSFLTLSLKRRGWKRE
jgi:hypothetical protein